MLCIDNKTEQNQTFKIVNKSSKREVQHQTTTTTTTTRIDITIKERRNETVNKM